MRILFTLLLFISLNGFSEGPKALVFTYPRSGTHWFMHCARYLLVNPEDRSIASKKIEHLDNFHSFEIYEHYENKPWQEAFDIDNDYMILVLRNYKESMLRHFTGDYNAVLKHLEDDRLFQKQLKFFSNLRHFEEWPNERKLLIYYEDLLSNPEYELRRYLTFLDIPDTRLPALLENISDHKQKMIDHYNKEHEIRNLPGVGSQSEGKDFLYHSKKVPVAILKEMELIAQERAPILYEKYLKRFEFSLNVPAQ